MVSFGAFLVAVAVVTCVIEVAAFDAFQNSEAERQVYLKDNSPFVSDDVRVGHERLEAQIGFMHMDLEQLDSYFHNAVSGQSDVYQYQSWKLPSLFVSEHGGDCEDYVLFALAVLDHSQYQLKPCVGTFEGEGHAFLIVDGDILVDSVGFVQPMPSDFSEHYEIAHEYNDMLEGGWF